MQVILRIFGKSRTETHTAIDSGAGRVSGVQALCLFWPHQPEPLGRVQTASRTIALGSARAACCWAVSAGMLLWLLPAAGPLQTGGPLGERVSVERWRRLGPGAREGPAVPVLLAALSPLALFLFFPQVSASGGLRAEGRGRGGGGEERGSCGAQPWICRAAHFGLDSVSDMSFF